MTRSQLVGGLVGLLTTPFFGLSVAPFLAAILFMHWTEPGWTTDRDVPFRLSAYTVGLPVTVLLIWLGKRRVTRAQGGSRAS